MKSYSQSKWDETIIVDLVHFRDFTTGDRALEREVLQIFLDNAPIYIENLSNDDDTKWCSIAHKLKGAARSIGAWNLACEAERAEDNDPAPPKGSQERATLIAELMKRFEQVKKFILDAALV